MATPTCFALLVGIDKYQAPVPALDGCVNDMRAMRDYLEQNMADSGLSLQMEILENEAATRLNIVQKFEKHLAQATEDDLAFFYFSGHGSQEVTHEIFEKIEEDGMNETIVCYDSRSHDGMDLADKELATLLDVVAQRNPHIVVIMDCCNSGSGTRGGVKVRAVRDLPPRVRSLDSYILPRKTATGRAAFSLDNPEQMVMPSPRHVALSAAQSFQLAKETLLGGSPRGVFTYSLLEVLHNAVGNLTYADLIRRVRNLVNERTFDQTPQLHAAQSQDQNLLFLNGSTTRELHYYALSHDREKGWHIDAGGAQGLIAGTVGGGKTLLNVFAEDAPESELRDPQFALGQVSVISTFPGYSEVRPEGTLFLDEQTAYRTRVHDMPVAPTKVVLMGQDDQAISRLKQAITADGEPSLYLELVANEAEADYRVTLEGTQFSLSRQSDRPDQPLVEQVEGTNNASVQLVVDQLLRIARWSRVLDLGNPGSGLPSESIKLEVLDPEKEQLLQMGPMGLVLRYQHQRGPDHYPQFRLRVVNRGHQRLYCGLLYLSSQFGVQSALPQGGVWLEPGAMAWVGNGTTIKGKVHQTQADLGRMEVHETFKVIFSNRAFDSRLMDQPEMGLPKPATRNVQADQQTRSLIFGSVATIDTADWNSNQLSITIMREDG